MRILAILLLSCFCLFGQTALYGPFVKFASSATTWYPTNAPNLWWWSEVKSPFTGTWGPTTSITPAADNTEVALWTNYAQSSSKLTSDQTLFATNFVSGGGGNGTSPRIFWSASTTTRMNGGSASTVGSQWTMLFVCNCVDTVNTLSGLYRNSSVPPYVRFTGGTALEFNGGSSTVTGPTTLTLGQWYIVTAIFDGASSAIYTNGVLYTSGSIGTTALGTMIVGQSFDTAGSYRGNISRIWVWTNHISAPNLASAVAQCKTDFGIQ